MKHTLKSEEARCMFLTLQELTKKQEMLIACTILYYKGINKKSVNKGTSYYGIIILDNNHSWEVPFLINNKLKNCCNDCVYCEIVTETKRRAIPENKTEVVLVNIKCSHMCVCSKYKKEVQDGR